MQRKYELSISADYVPEWGVTEAVREFFQNAIDEQRRDSENSMFFDYDPKGQVIRIGNRHSDLDIKTLLFGESTQRGKEEMIGSHGEGSKIATVVLLRKAGFFSELLLAGNLETAPCKVPKIRRSNGSDIFCGNGSCVEKGARK